MREVTKKEILSFCEVFLIFIIAKILLDAILFGYTFLTNPQRFLLSLFFSTGILFGLALSKHSRRVNKEKEESFNHTLNRAEIPEQERAFVDNLKNVTRVEP